MRRIDYQGREFLIHTCSGMRLLDAMREAGISIRCRCAERGPNTAACVVKWPRDAQFLLTAPTPFERQVLGDQLEGGHRLACQALFK